jgi:hypothetical protein
MSNRTRFVLNVSAALLSAAVFAAILFPVFAPHH